MVIDYFFLKGFFLLKKLIYLLSKLLGRNQMNEQKKSTNNTVVVQSNRFLDAPKNLTLNEYKLFMFIVSKINPNEEKIEKMRVTAEEFTNILGAKGKNNIYGELKTAADRLLNRIVKVHYPEKELFRKTHLVDSVDYWYGKGCVDIKISSEMKLHLLGLKDNFTQYKLSHISRLSSTYAIRLYELLKKQETLGQRTFFLEDLRNKLGISPETLQSFQNFRIKVLEIAKREINNKTDITIDYIFQKNGRKITTIIFDIKSKNSYRERNKTLYLDHQNEQNEKLIDKLLEFGYTKRQAQNIAYKNNPAIVENAIQMVEQQIKKGDVKNPKTILKTTIKKKLDGTEETFIARKNRKAERTNISAKIEHKRSGFGKFLFELFNRK